MIIKVKVVVSGRTIDEVVGTISSLYEQLRKRFGVDVNWHSDENVFEVELIKEG